MTGAKALTALAAALPLLSMTTVLLILAGAGANASPASAVCAGGGTGQTINHVALDAEQMANAHTIVTVTARRHLPPYAAAVALATAYTEARLRNPLIETDHDSEGLFQQRTSFYGRAVADDPVQATGAFLDRLTAVSGWQSQPVGVNAQAVQHSAYPNRYQPSAALARQLVAQLWPAAAAAVDERTATPAGSRAASSSAPTIVAVPAVCPGGGGAIPNRQPGSYAGVASTGNVVAGTTTIPPGLVLDGSARGDRAVRYALAQLGKPYQFGAAGPDAFDCSGLTMAAWATAGIPLPHLASAQAAAGRPESINLSRAVTGDLVFIPGSDGTPARPGHVGIIAGYFAEPDGRQLLVVQAPMSGLPVELTEISEWSGQVVAVRHIA